MHFTSDFDRESLSIRKFRAVGSPLFFPRISRLNEPLQIPLLHISRLIAFYY